LVQIIPAGDWSEGRDRMSEDAESDDHGAYCETDEEARIFCQAVVQLARYPRVSVRNLLAR
jgi:hypothetical protein